MSYDVSQVKSLFQKKPQSDLLKEACKHESRLAFHTIATISEDEVSGYKKDFLKSVRGLIPQDKFDRFKQLLEYPLETVSVTNDAIKNYERIFEGQNPFKNYQFTSNDLANDFNDYLENTLKSNHFFKKTAFNKIKAGINSVLVVDLPVEQEGELPEPYYYFVGVEKIIHVDVDRNGQIEGIIFYGHGGRICAYDDKFYRVFAENDGELILIVENEHDAENCPASFFWSDNLDPDRNLILKKSPFTDVLGKLDKYLKLITFKEHADLYSSFPIIVSLAQDCNFEGCQDGYIKKEYNVFDESTEEYFTDFKNEKCPACETRQLLGAGTNFELNVGEDGQMIQNPVQIVSADVKPLEYLKKKINELEFTIKNELIGYEGNETPNQALNETQVLGSFESRLNVLMSIKSQFERLEKWANSTVARFRYGNRFQSATVSYGDEFFLRSMAKLQEDYKNAKENGEPDEELQSIYEQIINYKYKGNDEQLKRAKTLYNLNPEPHKTVTECADLVEKGALSQSDYIIKSRFNVYIAKFERENTNVVSFGENLEFSKKIDVIYNELMSYAKEEISKKQEFNPLRKLVGGLNSVIEVSKAVAKSEITKNAGIEILINTLGFTKEEAEKMISEPIVNNF